MANTVTVTTVLDSPDLAVVQMYIKADGSSGDLSKSVIFDADTLSGSNAAWNIWRCTGTLNGFTAHIAFDQTTEVPVLVVPSNHFFDYEFNPSYKNHPTFPNPAGSGTTGDITVTTTGLNSGTEGVINLVVQKKRLQTAM